MMIVLDNDRQVVSSCAMSSQSGEIKQVVAVFPLLPLYKLHGPILLINGNLYYVLINFFSHCISILALSVVGALSFFVGGNSSGNVALYI